MKIKLIVVASMILITIALSGCVNVSNDSSGTEVKSYFEDEYDADENTILNVSTVNGAITVTSWNGENIILNATKRTRNGEDDLDNAEIVVTENGNEINIEIQHAQPIESRAVDLDIKIPYNVSVKTVISTNGGISVENVEGYVRATTTNGAIEIKGTTGIDDILSTNGGITAEIYDIQEDVNIQTTNGGIDLYIKSTLNSSIQITTTNGGIIVGGGFISVTESSSKSFKGTIGSGGNLINIITTNGGIRIYELEA
jgi:hypothetical protein